MNFKKKFLSAATTAALSFALMFGAPAHVSAGTGSLIGGLIGVGISAAQAKAQVDANIRHYNTTEAGSQELYKSFREKCGVNEDPYYNEMLDRIMANLTAGVAAVDPTIKEKPYKYFVTADESLNAWCTMGHVMAVNVGTFKILSTEDEVAAVVGHEMGHGQKDHSVKGQKKHLQKAITA
ncbi:MAG: M48 family metalloprotease, partial [Selenomonadaceae bacterium]|nr:M48 family metalloprotease [Selenomonadaceae bacterium]